MTDTRTQSDSVGTIVFDADLVPQVDHDWFDPATWQAGGRLRARGGGRGAACFIDTPAGDCVLRHFHRGGMVARILGDRYLWRGPERTRSLAEFRLLQRLHAAGLPVPRAVAARHMRHGLFYTADILTRTIEHAITLDACLQQGRLDDRLARRTGALVARFHRHGVWHADLNATNVLVTPENLYLIDFDRGRMRTSHTAWQQANLRRLRRSLIKLGAASDGEQAFENQLWKPLMQGYAQMHQGKSHP